MLPFPAVFVVAVFVAGVVLFVPGFVASSFFPFVVLADLLKMNK